DVEVGGAPVKARSGKISAADRRSLPALRTTGSKNPPPGIALACCLCHGPLPCPGDRRVQNGGQAAVRFRPGGANRAWRPRADPAAVTGNPSPRRRQRISHCTHSRSRQRRRGCHLLLPLLLLSRYFPCDHATRLHARRVVSRDGKSVEREWRALPRGYVVTRES